MAHNRSLLRLRPALWGALAAAFLAAAPVYAQTAVVLYERAQAREAELRKVAEPALTTIRSAAASYETVVRRYPRSGYSDNALWQAGTLYEWAFELGGHPRDRTQSARVFSWLAKEYPKSSLAKQALARVSSPKVSSPGVAAERTPTPAPPPAPARTAAAPAGRPAPAATAKPAAAPASPPLPNQILPASVTLTAISVTPLPKGDRLILELSQESTYTAARNASSGAITLQLSNVGLSVQALTAVATLRGSLIDSVRLTPRNGGTEVELRVAGQPRHSAFPLYGPYRLIVDVEGEAGARGAIGASGAVGAIGRAAGAEGAVLSGAVGTSGAHQLPALSAAAAALPPAGSVAQVVAPFAATPLSAAPRVSSAPVASTPAAPPAPSAPLSTAPPAPPSTQPPAPRAPTAPAAPSSGGYSLARQLGLGVSRVVIDPGHGGHDPGALAHGLSEAELVLDVALRLERLLLAQPGFEVVLTRRTNEFIGLEERTARANRESADLFLSIHANSSPQTGTRGVETYFLNFATNDQAEAVAARENAGSAQAMRLLPGLVKAITLNNKRTESRELAGMVQAALVKQMKLQNKSVKDLGVKQAPFVVLIGAEMPSVLAEISFITNRTDANLLKQGAYRQRVAQALADAVLRYQGSLKKVTPVATTAAGR